jgi:glycosyltransferase involved in cell wall biosynthesis
MQRTPLEIVVTNDQIFPLSDTDAEQIMNAMSAVGASDAVTVNLLLPAAWRRTPATADALAAYYEVEKNFSVCCRKSLFPSVRLFEKWGHAVSCLRHPSLQKADVLYTRNLPTFCTALLFSSKPVIYETFRPWPTQHPILAPFFRKAGANNRFLGVVTHSHFAKQSFLDVGIPEEKLLAAHNGYEPRRMEPVLSKSAARSALNLPQDGKIVSCVGHVTMKKGLGIMLRLADRLPKTHFVIVGSQGNGEVEQAAAARDNVRIVPWQPFRAAIPYLYASDVLFIPPTAGPLNKVGNTVLPIKTFLYMASGRPIFGPATPDLAELLEDGRNAVLVTPDDFDAALTGLRELLDDEAYRNRIAKNAYDDVSALTWSARSDRIVSFIQNRLEKSGITTKER